MTPDTTADPFDVAHSEGEWQLLLALYDPCRAPVTDMCAFCDWGWCTGPDQEALERYHNGEQVWTGFRPVGQLGEVMSVHPIDDEPF